MNMKTGLRILATLVVGIAGIASLSYAGPITVPVGLAPANSVSGTYIGSSTSGNSSQVWIQLCSNCANPTEALYGISGVLTVASPTAVPEPATMGLTFLALAILLFAMRRKHQGRRATGTIG